MNKLITLAAVLMMSWASGLVEAKSELELGAGVFAISLPYYAGSEQTKSYLLPMPYVYYQSDELKLESNELTGYLWHSGNWQLDFSAGGSIAVDSDDIRARTGMPDLDWVLELGPSLKYYLIGSPRASQQWFTEVYGRKAIATDFSSLSNAGWRFGPSMTYQQQFWTNGDNRFELTVRANVNFSDRRYLNYYYGVSSQYATAQRRQFDNQTGYSGSDLSLGLTYKTKSIWGGGFVRYNALSGTDLSDSPLVFKQNNWSVGLGVVWVFYSKINP